MEVPMLFLLLMSCGSPHLVSAILNDGALGEDASRCSRRVQRELDSMRRTAWGSRSSSHAHGPATLDLTGYALHQPLRSAPLDMYVTDMRVRVPAQTGWVRVERCQFDPRNQSLDTRLLFNDLTVSGRVKLYEDQVRGRAFQVPVPVPVTSACSMTLRLRHAGLGFTAVPAALPSPVVSLALPLAGALGLAGLAGRRHGQGAGLGAAPVEVRTNTHFVDPDFVSVYAHGCPSPSIEHRSDMDIDPQQDISQGRTHQIEDAGLSLTLTREMEDVFLRGIRTLLARYMERRLEPAFRDAVMAGMGYSVSYGR